jgi:hypothetical protein
VKPLADAVRNSFLLTAVAKGPEGEGAFQDEGRGVTCKYPEGYTVRLPRRQNHVVEFAGVSAEQVVLGIYHFPGEQSIEQDAETLVKYYAEEQGGEAATEPVQVGGRAGTLVVARASVGGKDQTFFIAVTKREEEFFRFRGAVAKGQEAEGRKAFDTFLRSIQIGPAPR